MGLFSFKKKQTYTLYRANTQANFETNDLYAYPGPSRLVLDYSKLGIFEDPYDGFGKKFKESSGIVKIQVSSDLFDLIRIANEFNNIVREKVKEELSDYFGKYFTLNDLTDVCDNPDITMFSDFKTIIYNYNQYN